MNIEKNVSLASFTTFGIGGSADFFVKVSSSQELVEAIKFAKDQRISFFVLGTGANILVADKGFRGLVIKNEAKKMDNGQLTIDNENKEIIQLTAESGVTIEELINFTKEKGLSGFEHFAGIPSSIGGALWQNLHFLSSDRLRTVYISEILIGAKIFTEQGEEKEVANEYFQFGYDYSILHDRKDIVLTAIFKLTPKSKEEIEKTIQANLLWRNTKHPENSIKTSAGSVFKKIEGYGAGRLIEKVGLKGYKIGGAMISPKHANFIVNIGGATAKDVRDVIHLVQKKVKDELGLELQTEISFIGEF